MLAPEVVRITARCDRCGEVFETLEVVYCYVGDRHFQCEDCAVVTREEAH